MKLQEGFGYSGNWKELFLCLESLCGTAVAEQIEDLENSRFEGPNSNAIRIIKEKLQEIDPKALEDQISECEEKLAEYEEWQENGGDMEGTEKVDPDAPMRAGHGEDPDSSVHAISPEESLKEDSEKFGGQWSIEEVGDCEYDGIRNVKQGIETGKLPEDEEAEATSYVKDFWSTISPKLKFQMGEEVRVGQNWIGKIRKIRMIDERFEYFVEGDKIWRDDYELKKIHTESKKLKEEWDDYDDEAEGGDEKYSKATFDQVPDSKSFKDHAYWNGEGPHQAEYDRLWAKLVPDSGSAKTMHGELLRCISRIYQDRYNNGFGNQHKYEANFIEERSSEIEPFLKNKQSLYKFLEAYERLRYGRKTVDNWKYDADMEDVVDAIIQYVSKVDSEGTSESLKESEDWGVKWIEFTKDSRQITKQRFFSTEKSREHFADILKEKDNFKEFVAWSDPSKEVEALQIPSTKKIEEKKPEPEPRRSERPTKPHAETANKFLEVRTAIDDLKQQIAAVNAIIAEKENVSGKLASELMNYAEEYKDRMFKTENILIQLQDIPAHKAQVPAYKKVIDHLLEQLESVSKDMRKEAEQFIEDAKREIPGSTELLYKKLEAEKRSGTLISEGWISWRKILDKFSGIASASRSKLNQLASAVKDFITFDEPPPSGGAVA